MINSVFLLNDARARDEQPNIVRAAKDTRRGIFPFDGRLQPLQVGVLGPAVEDLFRSFM